MRCTPLSFLVCSGILHGLLQINQNLDEKLWCSFFLYKRRYTLQLLEQLLIVCHPAPQYNTDQNQKRASHSKKISTQNPLTCGDGAPIVDFQMVSQRLDGGAHCIKTAITNTFHNAGLFLLHTPQCIHHAMSKRRTKAKRQEPNQNSPTRSRNCLRCAKSATEVAPLEQAEQTAHFHQTRLSFLNPKIQCS
jgi:hypothetical protein